MAFMFSITFERMTTSSKSNKNKKKKKGENFIVKAGSLSLRFNLRNYGVFLRIVIFLRCYENYYVQMVINAFSDEKITSIKN